MQIRLDQKKENLFFPLKISSKLAAKKIDFLDAPVSGGVIGAENGTLTIMVGGNENIFTEVLPIFNVLGSNTVLMGNVGSGQITKSCNQIIAVSYTHLTLPTSDLV